jgi:hypothetical protein
LGPFKIEVCPKALVRIPVWGRGKPGKATGWEKVHKQVIKILKEFLAGEE